MENFLFPFLFLSLVDGMEVEDLIYCEGFDLTLETDRIVDCLFEERAMMKEEEEEGKDVLIVDSLLLPLCDQTIDEDEEAECPEEEIEEASCEEEEGLEEETVEASCEVAECPEEGIEGASCEGEGIEVHFPWGKSLDCRKDNEMVLFVVLLVVMIWG